MREVRARTASGTAGSFEEFHRSRAKHAFLYARGVLGSSRAEDVCQEAWLRAWRSWGSADPDKLDAWLLTIVRNCCTDSIRARRPTVALEVDETAPADLPEVLVSVEDAVVTALELASAWLVLQQLPPALREALWLREVMDLSYAEIAELQEVPIGTVMSRLHAARKKARRLLRQARRS